MSNIVGVRKILCSDWQFLCNNICSLVLIGQFDRLAIVPRSFRHFDSREIVGHYVDGGDEGRLSSRVLFVLFVLNCG